MTTRLLICVVMPFLHSWSQKRPVLFVCWGVFPNPPETQERPRCAGQTRTKEVLENESCWIDLDKYFNKKVPEAKYFQHSRVKMNCRLLSNHQKLRKKALILRNLGFKMVAEAGFESMTFICSMQKRQQLIMNF